MPVEESPQLLDRLPPQDLEAERAVIGSLFIDPGRADDVALLVRPEDFYMDAHQKVYAAILAMRADGKAVDVNLVGARLKKSGELPAVGGLPYLGELAIAVPVAAHAEYYAEIVREKAVRRSLILAASDVLRDAYHEEGDTAELLARHEARLFALLGNQVSQQVTNIGDVLLESFANLEAGKPIGLGQQFAWPELTHVTGGLRKQELVVVAARPGVGKTSFALNLAERLTLHDHKTVLIASLEMSRTELVGRVLCSRAKVSMHRYRDQCLSSADHAKIAEAMNQLSECRLWIDDTPNRSPIEIGALARRIRAKHGLDLLVVDYLQLVRPADRSDNRQEQVASVTRRLKGLARELDVPVLCLAQLNRQADNAEPRLAHLRESGAVEQDSDVVVFLHRAKDDSIEVDCIVAKNRNGPIGRIRLVWLAEYTRFEALDTRAGYGASNGAQAWQPDDRDFT